jgi:hypothetical protein
VLLAHVARPLPKERALAVWWLAETAMAGGVPQAPARAGIAKSNTVHVEVLTQGRHQMRLFRKSFVQRANRVMEKIRRYRA